MSDTWSGIVNIRDKRSKLREKLARRQKEREGIIEDALGDTEDKKPGMY